MASDITTAEMKDGTWVAYETGHVVTIMTRGQTEAEARERISHEIRLRHVKAEFDLIQAQINYSYV